MNLTHPDVQFHEEHGLAPLKGHVTGPYAEPIKDAYKFAFEAPCSFTREGGSIGAVKTMEDLPGCQSLLPGPQPPQPRLPRPQRELRLGAGQRRHGRLRPLL